MLKGQAPVALTVCIHIIFETSQIQAQRRL